MKISTSAATWAVAGALGLTAVVGTVAAFAETPVPAPAPAITVTAVPSASPSPTSEVVPADRDDDADDDADDDSTPGIASPVSATSPVSAPTPD